MRLDRAALLLLPWLSCSISQPKTVACTTIPETKTHFL